MDIRDFLGRISSETFPPLAHYFTIGAFFGSKKMLVFRFSECNQDTLDMAIRASIVVVIGRKQESELDLR